MPDSFAIAFQDFGYLTTTRNMLLLIEYLFNFFSDYKLSFFSFTSAVFIPCLIRASVCLQHVAQLRHSVFLLFSLDKPVLVFYLTFRAK